MASSKGARAKSDRWFLAVSSIELLNKLDLLGGKRSTMALKALELGLDHLLANEAPASPIGLVESPEPAEPPPAPPAPKAPKGESSTDHGAFQDLGLGDDVCENPFADVKPVEGCPCSTCSRITQNEDADLMALVELSEKWRSEDAAQ